MIGWIGCKSKQQLTKGNLWPPNDYMYTMGKVVHITLNQFCESIDLPYNLILPGKWSFEETIHGCKQLRSNIFTYTDMVSSFFTEGENFTKENKFWTGYVVNETTHKFVASYNDDSDISITNFTWIYGEPNGKIKPRGPWAEKCVVIEGGSLNSIYND